MPYIITTHYRETDLDGRIIDEAEVSRRAVATLEDALRIVEDAIVHTDAVIGDTGAALIHDQEPWAWRARGQRDAITAEGGTVGPLPDGTVIEVKHAPLNPLADPQRWCDIYNGHHATA